MTHIYRMDIDHSHTHAWLVTVQRRGRIYNRLFTDTIYGGKRKALEAAKSYRDGLVKSLLPLTRLERCRFKRKNNRSGISGVTRIDNLEKGRGRTTIHRLCWLAQWPIGGGKARMKKFSIKQFGEQGAFQRAVRARQKALKALLPAPSMS